MRIKKNKLLFPICTVFFLLSLAVPCHAATLEVRPDNSQDSIQEVLARAAPGDTIYVHPGTYVGQIVIDKPVSLIGLGTPILDGGGESDVVSIKVDGVNIKGFEIRGSGKKLQNSDSGIKCYSQGNTIEDNRIVNNLFGIYMLKSPGNNIRRNLIIGRTPKNRQNNIGQVNIKDNNEKESFNPMYEGEGGDGIHLFSSSNNVIENNVILDTRDGIYFNYAHNNRLLNNRISGVRYAIHYMYSDDNYFEGNIATNNVAGAAPMYSKRITFRNNVFAHNRGHRSFGVLFATCNDCVAEGNIIIGNTRGVFFDVSYHNIFRNNLVAGNDIGIDLISSSGFNKFVANNFIDNLEQIAFRSGRIGKGNVFYEEGKGNYWNDYQGFDLDRNGIGDTPYLTGDPFTFLMNKAPAVRLFLNSPAASALKFAENMFPIIQIPKAKDLYPLIQPMEIKVPHFEYENIQVSNRVFGRYSLLMLLFAALIFTRAFSLSSRSIQIIGYFFSKGG